MIENTEVVMETKEAAIFEGVTPTGLLDNRTTFKDGLLANNPHISINQYSSHYNSIWEADEDDWETDNDEPNPNDIDDPYCPVSSLTKDQKLKLYAPWRKALIVKFWGGLCTT